MKPNTVSRVEGGVFRQQCEVHAANWQLRPRGDHPALGPSRSLAPWEGEWVPMLQPATATPRAGPGPWAEVGGEGSGGWGWADLHLHLQTPTTRTSRSCWPSRAELQGGWRTCSEEVRARASASSEKGLLAIALSDTRAHVSLTPLSLWPRRGSCDVPHLKPCARLVRLPCDGSLC